jgi:hypothetical protein
MRVPKVRNSSRQQRLAPTEALVVVSLKQINMFENWRFLLIGVPPKYFSQRLPLKFNLAHSSLKHGTWDGI